MYKKVIQRLSKLNKNQILIGVAVLAILVTGVLVSNPDVLSFFKFNSMSQDAIAKNAVDFLNKSVLQQGQVATLESISQESGLIKIKLKIGANSYDSYATRDGKLLFPEAFKIDASASASAAANSNTPSTPAAAATPATVAKVAKTSLEAYVVSGCPFGLQMQRAMADAIKNAPSLSDYVKVRYIGSVASGGKTITAMHGKEEADENLRQICIRDEQPAKYWNYVGCYMKNAAGKAANGMPYGDTATCQKTAGIDTAKLNSCVSDPARGVAFAKADFDLNTKYDVTGSPTLILNGAEVSENAFGGRSAKGVAQMVCSSSTTPPSFCKDAQFSTDPASTSFSLSYAAPGGTGATASCAPAVQ